MKTLALVMVAGLLVASTAFAGPKDDFIAAVKKYCGKDDATAASWATPGRSGTVMKWKMCTADSIDINGCKLPCKDASSSIGG